MEPGTKVLVYPHGSPEKAAQGEVVLTTVRGGFVVVSFPTLPVFALGQPPGIHDKDGVRFYAIRYNGYTPWVELWGGGHYEIEEAR